MSLRAAFLGAALLGVASGAAALDMPPGAVLSAQTERGGGGTYAVPIARFQGGAVPMLTIRGPVTRQAWHVVGGGLTPFQAIEQLRAQATAEGFHPAFECETDRCGGFDFRFAIDVMQAPAMFVNLRNFHFATLLRGPEGAPDAAMTLLASRTQDRLYLQITTVHRAEAETAAPQPRPARVPAQTPPGMDALLTDGHMVLEGLEFDSGATALGPGPFEALGALATFLNDNPRLRVALVGHTDSVGGLQGNIGISRQRAQAVRQRLIERYGIPGARMEAEGMGYLAPRASNLTPEGRDANRRVEVIVLSED